MSNTVFHFAYKGGQEAPEINVEGLGPCGPPVPPPMPPDTAEFRWKALFSF